MSCCRQEKGSISAYTATKKEIRKKNVGFWYGGGKAEVIHNFPRVSLPEISEAMLQDTTSAVDNHEKHCFGNFQTKSVHSLIDRLENNTRRYILYLQFINNYNN